MLMQYYFLIDFIKTYIAGTMLMQYFLIVFIKTYVAGTCLKCVPTTYKSRQFNKNICCRYSIELSRLVEAIQMSTHNIQVKAIQMSTHIMFFKRSRRKYTGYNQRTTKLLDCALLGVCAVIRSNTVFS